MFEDAQLARAIERLAGRKAAGKKVETLEELRRLHRIAKAVAEIYVERQQQLEADIREQVTLLNQAELVIK